MKKNYNLTQQGLAFKADFNHNFHLIRHILDIRTKQGYLKIDLVQHANTNKHYLARRTANFTTGEASLELVLT